MNPNNTITAMIVYGNQSSYIQPPSDAQKAAGTVPLDTLPADWWNRMWMDITQNMNNAGESLESVYQELKHLLEAAGITPSSTSTSQVLAAVRRIARTIATSDTAGAVVSSSISGKVSVDQDGVMTPNGMGTPTQLNTSSKVIVTALNEVLSSLNNYMTTTNSTLNGKAPTSHASSATIYGAGNASNYGHVKLCDGIDSTCRIADGIAATPAAVKCAYDKAVDACSKAVSILASAYPVGTVYMNALSATLPASLAEVGTWTAIDGKFLRACSSCIGCTGGAPTVTLAVCHLPSHCHATPNHCHAITDHKHSGSVGAHCHTGPSHCHATPGHCHSMTHCHAIPVHTHCLAGSSACASSCTLEGDIILQTYHGPWIGVRCCSGIISASCCGAISNPDGGYDVAGSFNRLVCINASHAHSLAGCTCGTPTVTIGSDKFSCVNTCGTFYKASTSVSCAQAALPNTGNAAPTTCAAGTGNTGNATPTFTGGSMCAAVNTGNAAPTTCNTGSGCSFSILPPHLNVAMWYRSA